MTLTALLLAVAPAAAQATTAAPAPAMSVSVETAADATADVRRWAQELRQAVAERPQEFRAPRKGEKPELVVRIDSLARASNGENVLSAVLLAGKQSKPFTLRYGGDSRPMARKLAGHLRAYAKQAQAGAGAPAARP